MHKSGDHSLTHAAAFYRAGRAEVASVVQFPVIGYVFSGADLVAGNLASGPLIGGDQLFAITADVLFGTSVLPGVINTVDTNQVSDVSVADDVNGMFVDPGSDLWQATLVVQDSGTQATLLRLPLAISGQAFSTSFVIGQQSSVELILEVDDGTGVVTSQPILVFIGVRLPGDYDVEGDVDTNDYNFWKAHFGNTSGVGLQADGNGNGVVDAADDTVWRDHLSSGLGGGAGSTASVSTANPVNTTPLEPETTGPAVTEMFVAGPLVEGALAAEDGFQAGYFLRESISASARNQLPTARFARAPATDWVLQNWSQHDANGMLAVRRHRAVPLVADIDDLVRMQCSEIATTDGDAIDSAFDSLADELVGSGGIRRFVHERKARLR